MIDLHVHSTASDGTLSPTQLVEFAKASGVSTFALTDHDCFDGLSEAIEVGAKLGIQIIPGIEISLDPEGPGTFHLLGYFIDYQNKSFQKNVLDLQEARRLRNPKILHKLNELGLPLTMADVIAASGGGQIGRVHFAKALVNRGLVSSIPEAFEKYLAKGKSAYFKKAILTPQAGIELIIKAGGVPVLAHPFSLDKGEKALDIMVKDLVSFGLAGMEVYYPMHSSLMIEAYSRIADKYKLIKTGGTDFHGTNKPGVILGQGLKELGLSDSVIDQLQSRRSAVQA